MSSSKAPTSLILAVCWSIWAATGCINNQSRTGVENTWREEARIVFEVGKTTRGEVIKVLGPPSQVISSGDRLVFYYLLEERIKRGMILIAYNQLIENVTYDRAIFFFNKDGILEEFAFSPESVPREPAS